MKKRFFVLAMAIYSVSFGAITFSPDKSGVEVLDDVFDYAMAKMIENQRVASIFMRYQNDSVAYAYYAGRASAFRELALDCGDSLHPVHIPTPPPHPLNPVSHLGAIK